LTKDLQNCYIKENEPNYNGYRIQNKQIWDNLNNAKHEASRHFWNKNRLSIPKLMSLQHTIRIRTIQTYIDE
jgi:hypothetical protein